MITEVIVVRLEEDGVISYEIRDQNETYLDDANMLEAAVDKAHDFAAAHSVEYVKIRMAPEVHIK